jgi:hypothetical protein
MPTTLKSAWVFEFRTKAAKSGGPERIRLWRAIAGLFCAGPVNRFAPKTPGKLPLSAESDLAESVAGV